MPVTWQGWLALALYIAVVIGGTLVLRNTPRNEFTGEVAIFIGIVLFSTLVLLLVSVKKGPKPSWRWGSSDEDNPGEDF